VDPHRPETDRRMRRTLTFLAALWLGALTLPRIAAAQGAAVVLAQGVRAYDDLEFDNAAGLLRRALAVQGADALAPAAAARALIYLAATELLREHTDSARAVSRRLVLSNPRFRPDELVFPPQVLTFYEGVRRATPAVIARAAIDTAIRPGAEALEVRLFASTFHDVAATLATEDGRVLRTLYTGPISDSLDLHWNGLDSTGNKPPPAGRYAITVTSLDRQRRVVRILRLPLEVTPGRVDTLPHPAPPPDSLLLPERTPVGPGLRAFAPGALAGVAIAVLPSVVASGEKASGARFVVGGAATIAGIVAFFSHHPGRSIPANAAHNRTLREAWRREDAEVARRNAERARGMLGIRTGAPVLLTPEAP
jgi:hypothetical protein